MEFLADALHAVIADWKMLRPDREIDAVIWISRSVHCDLLRVQQLLSNLLDNALTYGASESQVTVNCLTEGQWLTLSVHNFGAPFDLDRLPEIFQSGVRFLDGLQLGGLGRGLYLCHEIAKAHGGSLEISSNQIEGTLFRVNLPLLSQQGLS
ncbi:sensor histidine kinase [Chitinimonas naiadis]